MKWEIVREGKGASKVLRVRCIGIDPDHVDDLTNTIDPDIHKIISAQPCLLTGSTANVEVDHRAGNKTHPLHRHVDDPAKQKVSDFMPLCRAINHIKREACKQCIATGTRPNAPALFGGLPMKPGEGCNGCFWFEPESYV